MAEVIGTMLNQKRIKSLLWTCTILVLAVTLCALVMSREYTSQIISQEKLYGSSGENLKDFVESNGNLIAQSADPWINCDLIVKGRIACIEIDVDCLDAKGSSCQIFDTDTWQSYRKNLHEGRNYIYLYNSELEWNSQHLRFDIVEAVGASVSVNRVVINPVLPVLVYFFIMILEVLALGCLGVFIVRKFVLVIRCDAIKVNKKFFLWGINIAAIICIAYLLIIYLRIRPDLLIMCLAILGLYFLARKYKLTLNHEPKPVNTMRIAIMLFSMAFSISCVAGKHIVIEGDFYTGRYLENYITEYSLKDAAGFIALAIVVYCGLLLGLDRLWKVKLISHDETSLNVRWKAMFVMLACWIPYFLVYYPGFILGDSCSSIHQALGEYGLKNHHPIIYTLFIRICLNIGKIFGDLTLGCAIYTILQMLYVSYALGVSIEFLLHKGINRKIGIAITLFFGLTPFYAQVSISMWKDPIFSATVLLWTILLLNDSNKRDFALKNTFLLLLICFTRNNGIYIAVFCEIMAVFIYVVSRKRNQEKIKIWIVSNAIVIACGGGDNRTII